MSVSRFVPPRLPMGCHSSSLPCLLIYISGWNLTGRHSLWLRAHPSLRAAPSRRAAQRLFIHLPGAQDGYIAGN
jgi:hypothetical protein